MSTEVTVTLPDDVFRRAVHLAELTHRDVEEVLADALRLSLAPIAAEAVSSPPVSSLADDEVVALANSRMEKAHDRRLVVLQRKLGAGALRDEERSELQGLMHAYQDGLLRKAQALREAVQRGLIERAAS
jgi:hypothetical protein